MYVIVEDRRPDKPAAGDLISELERGRLETKRVHVMPADPNLMNMNAVAGYFRRDFGRGAKLPDSLPGQVCSLILYTQARSSVLHWRARIECTLQTRKEAKPLKDVGSLYVGSLRLTSDTSQGISAGTVGSTNETAFNFSRLSDDQADERGWVVGGSARFSAHQDGMYGFALYGVGRGFRVIWAAITQTG